MDADTHDVDPSAFEVRLRNVGPIHRADLVLRPLTLLIGPNNSGKSVAATALHVVTTSSPPSFQRSRRILPRRRFSYVAEELEESLQGADVPRFLDEIMPQDADGNVQLSSEASDVFQQIAATIFRSYGMQLSEQLQAALGSDLDDIIRVQDGRRMPARIDVESKAPSWCVALRFARPQPRVEISQKPDLAEFMRHLHESEYTRYFRRIRRPGRTDYFLPEIIEAWGAILFNGFPQSSYYLPAARSGILQSHRTLAAALVRSSTRAGIEDMSVPKVSGLIADFISEVLEITPRRSKSEFSDIAQYLERGILHGDVGVSMETRYPEIAYRAAGLELPLHRTSSMVSELAPVVLYLRYIVESGDLMVIEEPESHLHPENQLLVARAIARMASSGLTVALTTHSDYLLQSLSNAIRATSAGNRTLVNDLAGSAGLARELVGAYLFTPGEAERGTDTRQISVSSESGISDDEFARVTELLYRETITIDRLVEH